MNLRIRERREALGLTQTELAKELLHTSKLSKLFSFSW